MEAFMGSFPYKGKKTEAFQKKTLCQVKGGQGVITFRTQIAKKEGGGHAISGNSQFY